VANNLGGGDKYLYLSPFAGWTLQVEKKDHLDWTHVKTVKFFFKANFIPSDAKDFAALMDEHLMRAVS
jgi:hypothetical protein